MDLRSGETKTFISLKLFMIFDACVALCVASGNLSIASYRYGNFL